MERQAQFDLLVDIGRAHAKLALQVAPYGDLLGTERLACCEYAGLKELLHGYLQMRDRPSIRRAAIVVGTAVTHDQVVLSDLSWSFSQLEVMSAFQWEQLLVLNDFSALALSLPSIDSQDRMSIGDVKPEAAGPIALIGPDAGLGMSGLLPNGYGGWVPISGEGGHCTVAANDNFEVAIVAYLKRYMGHVSTERVLSAQGLVNLYNAVCYVNGMHASPLEAGDILRMGQTEGDSACGQALDCFCSFLGNAAGNWALSLGATGGVYIAGSIAPNLMRRLGQGRFRKAFESKGRLSTYLHRVPTWVLKDQPWLTLHGASRALNNASGQRQWVAKTEVAFH